MMRPPRQSLFILVTILITIVAFPAHAKDRYTLEGDIHNKVVRDTLILTYDLYLSGIKPDTLHLDVVFLGGDPSDPRSGNRDIYIGNADESGPHAQTPGFHLESKNGVFRLRGSVKVPFTPELWPRGCHADVRGSVDKWYIPPSHWVEFHRSGALTLTLVPPVGIAYYKTRVPADSTRNGIAGGFEFNAFFDIRHSRFTSGYRATIGKDFVVKEATPMKFRYYLGNRNDFLPAFSAAVKYSVLNYEVGEVDRKTADWGVEAGVALEGPFERLSYEYCTGLDGYHKTGLFIANKSMGLGKSGTLYEWYHFKSTDMFRIAVYYEGIGMGEGAGHGATSLPRRNNRPFIHKALAFVGILPAAPVYLLIMTISP
jgi:hypothetical protein